MPKPKQQPIIKKFTDEATKFLKGKTVSHVRYMNKKEIEHYYWHEAALVIFFTDGTYIIPSVDPEGNGPGCLFTSSEELPTIPQLNI